MEKTCWFWLGKDSRKKSWRKSISRGELQRSSQWKRYRRERSTVDQWTKCAAHQQWDHHSWLLHLETGGDWRGHQVLRVRWEQAAAVILPEGEPCGPHCLWVWPAVPVGSRIPANPGKNHPTRAPGNRKGGGAILTQVESAAALICKQEILAKGEIHITHCLWVWLGLLTGGWVPL